MLLRMLPLWISYERLDRIKLESVSFRMQTRIDGKRLSASVDAELIRDIGEPWTGRFEPVGLHIGIRGRLASRHGRLHPGQAEEQRFAMRQAGMSPSQFCEHFGISRKLYRKFEAGIEHLPADFFDRLK